MVNAAFWQLQLLLLQLSAVLGGMESCVDERGHPQRCLPKFENAAFNKTLMASNTCGAPAEDYCRQTGPIRSCHRCDATEAALHHNATYLTDFHSDEDPTWWQSQSMFFGVQHPNSVNLTLHLGKSYEISYIRLKFHTSRPESFAIYKRTHDGGPWIPYQFYSASCLKTYGKSNRGFIQVGEDEQQATCTDEFSDISPLTGGNVAFSTLEGRPSAYNFDQSPVLQEWVTATDLLVSLNRLNTFGDEFFKDPKVLQAYYYAVSDFSVGGRCKCNGHASDCVLDERGWLVCDCQHNTAGVDCDKCQPFYHDRPWARATADSANECLACNCSGRSEECVFDAELYRSQGHGGRCLNCRDNTDGPNCERCRDGFYRTHPKDVCHPCNCSILGSTSLQCDSDGRCVCKANVTGEKCDRCQPGHHSLSASGCRQCDCHPVGTTGFCSPLNGQCLCKKNVEGYTCDRCKPGTFNLDPENLAGCTECFCHGHSAICQSAPGYSVYRIASNFTEGADGWLSERADGSESLLVWNEGGLHLNTSGEDQPGFFKAPEKFLGDQQLSYGQPFSITFSGNGGHLIPRNVMLVIEGPAAMVTAHLPRPESVHSAGTFVFRLHEDEVGIQEAPLSSQGFRQILSNLTAIKISGTRGSNGSTWLSEVSLLSATPGHFPPALWVEECTCPQEYTGRLCEKCAPGYKREILNGGPSGLCVPCTCHQHGICHPDTGVCQCWDNTTGPACERCLDGFYGDPLAGKPSDCQLCPCPGQSSCAIIPVSGELVCTNCPLGQRGVRCQLCDDGFYGDPLGIHGVARPCQQCQCNGNVDPNAVGVCDHVGGGCLKCLHNTEGARCERCREGYYGNALHFYKCKPCNCSSAGSITLERGCHLETGQCPCLNLVAGRDCGQCEMGSFNLQPGIGCQRCNCSLIGSLSPACHPISGQCQCQPGVEGLKCTVCRRGFFSFSSRGCRACNCSPMGSVIMQCHNNGTCVCRQGFTGYKCDQCQVNFFNDRTTHQCEECPVCYGLVLHEADKLKGKLQRVERLLQTYECRHWRGFDERLLQGDSPQSNSLEDLLAVQDARDAFVQQFTSLQGAVVSVQTRLQMIHLKVNCSLGGSGRLCSSLAVVSRALGATQQELEKAVETLGGMVISGGLPDESEPWAAYADESRLLAASHRQTAESIELVARTALRTSNETFILLAETLEDNSSAECFRELSQRLLTMQAAKKNITNTIGDLQSAATSVHEEVQEKISNGLHNVTSRETEELPCPDHLRNETLELEELLQSKDELINQALLDIKPHADLLSTERHRHAQLSHRAQQAQGKAEGALLKVREVETEAQSLVKELQEMKKGWHQKKTQTKMAMKKVQVVKDKILADTTRKTRLVKRQLLITGGNSTAANVKAQGAQGTAVQAASDAQELLSQAKKIKRETSEMNSAILEELRAQEMRGTELRRAMEERDEIAGAVLQAQDSMRSAALSLEQQSRVLRELLVQINSSQESADLESLLNETASQLEVLRQKVQSEPLGLKITALEEAAKRQDEQIRQVEQDIVEILEEKLSLEDIVRNVPSGCTKSPQ
ncbi:laminin subunit gamma-3 [Polypterus senegalus]|uniref:laminin subunit gamma-3 n=1 Tax=Polypterus senegalus TaxID=55291 RepID=UPI0019662F35|nr:laminin subunit gamma-3 [Polypterus senegalus]